MCASVSGCRHRDAHNTNGRWAWRAPYHAAGTATRPVRAAITASLCAGHLSRVALPGQAMRGKGRSGELSVEVAVGSRDVAALTPEAVHLDAVALVQQPVQRHAVGREVIGDQGDGRHRLRGGDAPMNVLILHNRYREAGGEERSVGAITRLLRARGHSVEVLERSSATVGRARAGGSAAGRRSRTRGGRAGRACAPGRCRARAQHPPAVRRPRTGRRPARRRAGRDAPAQLPPGLCDRDRLPRRRRVHQVPRSQHAPRSEAALPGKPPRGRRVRCRASRASSGARSGRWTASSRPAPLRRAASRTRRSVTRPSRSCTTSSPTKSSSAAPPAGRGSHALFAGRLVEEKGADTAILASAASRVPLAIAGSGPDEPRLRRLASEHDAPVTFMRRIPPEQMPARALAGGVRPCSLPLGRAVPLHGDRGDGRGLPVLASERGGLPEMVGSESVLPDRDVDRWAAAMRTLWEDDAARIRRAEQALCARPRAVRRGALLQCPDGCLRRWPDDAMVRPVRRRRTCSACRSR